MNRSIDTGTDDLLARVDDGVGVITFNRPERRNALSDDIYAAFEVVLPAFEADSEVRVVLMTGAGGAFCAGGDVKESAAESSRRTSDRVERLRRNQRNISLRLYEFPTPVVAALPGAAAGAGLSIALAADIRLAAERSVLLTAFRNVGGSGDFGGSWFLTQLVGPSKARELYFTSPRLTAQDALQLGIVNQVLPDDGFDDAALDYCKEMASGPPIALRQMKENLNRAQRVGLAEALDAEAPAMVRTMSTADSREAVQAFLAKRPAVYRGA